MSKSSLFGSWGKFQRMLTKLEENPEQYFRVIESMGEKITERLWDIIEGQEIYLEPLTKEYEFRKAKEGYDERTLIRTGDYLNSIKVIDITSSGDSLEVTIGVEDGTTETGISMKQLALYIEYGTADQPARMPFQRSWEVMKKDVEQEVSERIYAKIEEVMQ